MFLRAITVPFVTLSVVSVFLSTSWATQYTMELTVSQCLILVAFSVPLYYWCVIGLLGSEQKAFAAAAGVNTLLDSGSTSGGNTTLPPPGAFVSKGFVSPKADDGEDNGTKGFLLDDIKEQFFWWKKVLVVLFILVASVVAVSLALVPPASPAWQHYQHGMQYYYTDKERANGYLSEAVKLEPNNVNYVYALAKLVTRGDRYSEEGIELFERAIALQPNDPELHYAFAQYMWYVDQGRCISECKRALELDPDHKEARASLSWYLINGFNDLQGAKEHLVKLVDRHPSYAEGRIALGNLFAHHLEDAEKGCAEWEAALSLDDFDEEINSAIVVNHRALCKNEGGYRDVWEKDKSNRLQS